MEELRALVDRAAHGDSDAFGQLVRRFQDMAVGYGYVVLGDLHHAEDAAQEAFLEAYRSLPKLRQPAAFPGWLRAIVFKHCDRRARRGRCGHMPLDPAALIDPGLGPAEAIEVKESGDRAR